MTTNNEGKLVPVVLFPRYTTLVGSGGTEFQTLPVDVAPYDGARITLWHAPMLGTTPKTTFFFDESTDRNTWTNSTGTPVGGLVIGPSNEYTEAFTPERKWFRLRVRIDGTQPAVTCFAHGLLVKRQR